MIRVIKHWPGPPCSFPSPFLRSGGIKTVLILNIKKLHTKIAFPATLGQWLFLIRPGPSHVKSYGGGAYRSHIFTCGSGSVRIMICAQELAESQYSELVVSVASFIFLQIRQQLSGYATINHKQTGTSSTLLPYLIAWIANIQPRMGY